MGLTALQAQGQGLGAAAIAEYRGAQTAAHFGDPQAEFAALHNGCGVHDLGFHAKILLTGADRTRWLNGMVTNNIRDLAVSRGLYAFLLNPQGHILGDLYTYNRGESIIVDTECGQVEKILATFDHYIIMDDVEVRNLAEELTALGIAGPRSREALVAAGFTFSKMQPLQLELVSWKGVECTLVRGEDEQREAYEIWMASSNVKRIWDALRGAGAAAVGSEALEMARIEAGIPRYGIDIRERDLPQETDQARALNFNKGCYVGQEIVERIRSRGAVHRKFSGFLFNASEEILPGTKVISGEKEVGEITSVANLPIATGRRTVALGYIRREIGTPGREVMIGTATARVVPLPFTETQLLKMEGSLEQRRA